MSEPLNVAFLWHMHQPSYRDPSTGQVNLPWVRLHGLKGYTDMLAAAQRFSDLRVTFNFTPCLVQQLSATSETEPGDFYFELSAKPAADLDPEEKQYLLQRFFSANWETMVLPYPRYRELLYRRGRRATVEDIASVLPRFNASDWRDLQVWFNLTWCGWAAEERFPEIAHLKKKDRDFTEEEKQHLLALHQEVLKQIIPSYKKSWAEGSIEISTSPFHHPVLPLIIDSSCARLSQPLDPMPERPFQRLADAREQLQRGRDYLAEQFGQTPVGLWPSEGSVSPAVCELADEAGFQWLATDEDVLLATLGKGNREQAIYQTYLAYPGGPTLVFRDRFLSDAIGFRYARNTPKQAVDDFLGHLEGITAAQASPGKSLAAIILDGENAWEYFPDGGRGFLERLYEQLVKHPKFRTTTIAQFVQEKPAATVLPPIFPASWIQGSFRIWIGDPVKNAAWDRLKATAEAWDDQSRKVDLKSAAQKARDYLLVAEGSDWFWWYGEPNHSDFEDQFDHLFRMNQAQVYRELGLPVPDELLQPMIQGRVEEEYPLFPIQPLIDGKETTYYEWIGARVIRASDLSGSMNFSSGLIEKVYYGLSPKDLYLRMDPLEQFHKTRDLRLIVRFIGPGQSRVELQKFRRRSKPEAIWCCDHPEREIQQVAYHQILELAIPFEFLPADHDEVHFALILMRGNLEIERWPRMGSFSCPCPTEDYLTKNWVV